MTGSNSARAASVALLFVVLTAGFLLGMAWDGSEVASASTTEATAEEPERERRDRRLVIHEVGLEAGQRTEVDGVIDHYRGLMKELNEEFEAEYGPRRRELIRQTRDSIKALLSEQQVQVYDSLLASRYGNQGRGRDRDQSDGGRGGY